MWRQQWWRCRLYSDTNSSTIGSNGRSHRGYDQQHCDFRDKSCRNASFYSSSICVWFGHRHNDQHHCIVFHQLDPDIYRFSHGELYDETQVLNEFQHVNSGGGNENIGFPGIRE